MLHLNIEAVTSLSSLVVRDYKDKKGTKLINISSCGGYVIVPTAIFLLNLKDERNNHSFICLFQIKVASLHYVIYITLRK